MPYTLGVLSGITVERAAEMAPDVLWFQLYRFHRDGHRIGLELARRAAAVGVKALVLTIDTPTRTIRPRETKSGIVNPFKLTNRLRLDALTSPRWLLSMRRHGIPRFASLAPYMKPNASLAEAAEFIRRESGGAFTWDEIARYRDVWKGPLVLKGVLHPADARRALELGVDGLFVTNHGGRQIDACPHPSTRCRPSLRKRRDERRSSSTPAFAQAWMRRAPSRLARTPPSPARLFCGASARLGEEGPPHLINVLKEDLRATMGQLGCFETKDLRSVARRHNSAWRTDDYATGAA